MRKSDRGPDALGRSVGWLDLFLLFFFPSLFFGFLGDWCGWMGMVLDLDLWVGVGGWCWR